MHNQNTDCCLPEIFPSCPNFHLYFYLGRSPLRPNQCLHKLSQSSWENNRTYCIRQLYTSHATFTYLAQNFHLFTSNDRQSDSPHLEEKGTFTKWTAFSGFLFSSPKIFTTQEKRMCCRLWSRRHRQGSAVVWRRGRRESKEVWSVIARWIKTNLSPEKQENQTRQNWAVSTCHLHAETQWHHTSD